MACCTDGGELTRTVLVMSKSLRRAPPIAALGCAVAGGAGAGSAMERAV
jgi:hypothetical protein